MRTRTLTRRTTSCGISVKDRMFGGVYVHDTNIFGTYSWKWLRMFVFEDGWWCGLFCDVARCCLFWFCLCLSMVACYCLSLWHITVLVMEMMWGIMPEIRGDLITSTLILWWVGCSWWVMMWCVHAKDYWWWVQWKLMLMSNDIGYDDLVPSIVFHL